MKSLIFNVSAATAVFFAVTLAWRLLSSDSSVVLPAVFGAVGFALTYSAVLVAFILVKSERDG